MKGGLPLPANGTLVAHIYTSNAQIPLPGSTLTVTRTEPDGRLRLLGVRISNFDGFTSPIVIETPARAESQQYTEGQKPYATVDIRMEHTQYDRVFIRNVQIFPDTQSLQEQMLVPTPALPDSYSRTETIVIPEQLL